MTRVQTSQGWRSASLISGSSFLALLSDMCIFSFRLVCFAKQLLVTAGTEFVLSRQIAMFWADGEGRRDGQIRDAVTLQRPPHQLPADGRAGHRLPHVEVEDRAAGVFALQLLLEFQRLKRVVGVADRQLRRISVVGGVRRTGLYDIRVTFAVLFGKAVRGPFRRGGLQIVHVAGLLLELHHPGADVVKDAPSQRLPVVDGYVMDIGGEVAEHLVDPVDADGGKVVAQSAEVSLGVGKKTAVHVALYHL